MMELPEPEEGFTEKEAQELAARLSAEYLPSIYKTISEATELPDTAENSIRHVMFITVKPSSAYDRRFVREHGDKAFAYFLALLRIAYHLPDDLLEPSTEGPSEAISLHLLTLVRELRQRFDDLLSCYPGDSLPASPVSDSQRMTLRRLAGFVESNPPADMGELERNRSVRLLVEYIPNLRAISLFKTREEGAPETPFAWDGCEWLIAECEKKGDVGCVELKADDELQACSRCLTVRYCSKEHQKLHWKQHKHECFKSSW